MLDPSSGPDLLRYLLASAALIGAILMCGWAARRFLAANLSARASGRSLRVVDVLPVGRRQRLCVVRVYDRTFVLGVGEKEVGLVAELDRDAAAPTLRPAPRTAAGGGLIGAFERLRAKVGERAPTPRPETPARAPAAREARTTPKSRLGAGRGLLG